MSDSVDHNFARVSRGREGGADGSDEAELSAVLAEFRRLVARWRLTQGELRTLLREPPCPIGCLPRTPLDVRAETTVRLLLRLERCLEIAMPTPGEVAEWLRLACDGAPPLLEFADPAVLGRVVRGLEARRDGPR